MAPRRIEMTGLVFGRLTVIGPDHYEKKGWWWQCRCECGMVIATRGNLLRAGRTRSCGCLMRELLSINKRKHGESPRGDVRSREYNAWTTLRRKRSVRTVDPRWDDFRMFLADMGRCPYQCMLYRPDRTKPWGPGNAEWRRTRRLLKNHSTVRSKPEVKLAPWLLRVRELRAQRVDPSSSRAA